MFKSFKNILKIWIWCLIQQQEKIRNTFFVATRVGNFIKLQLQKHIDPNVRSLAYLCIRKTAALVVDWQMCAKNQRELVCKCGGHSLKSTYHRLKSAFKLNKFLAMKFPNYFLSQIDITKVQLNSECIYEIIFSPKMPTKNLKDFYPTL